MSISVIIAKEMPKHCLRKFATRNADGFRLLSNDLVKQAALQKFVRPLIFKDWLNP